VAAQKWGLGEQGNASPGGSGPVLELLLFALLRFCCLLFACLVLPVLLRFLLFPVCLFFFAGFASFFAVSCLPVCSASFLAVSCFARLAVFVCFFSFFFVFVVSALPGPQFS